MLISQFGEKIYLEKEINNSKNKCGFSIQMFLDIAGIYLPNQQNLICSNNQYNGEQEKNDLQLCSKTQNSQNETKIEVSQQNYCIDQIQQQLKNSNLMKNILKSFQRYVENEEDEEQKQFFCNITKVSYGHNQLCKFLKYSLKTEGKRWNMKAKNLVEKSKLKPLFEYYLININKFWLENSKVSNKEEHYVLSRFLLNQIQNPNSCSKIRYYQKSKQIIKSNF